MNNEKLTKKAKSIDNLFKFLEVLIKIAIVFLVIAIIWIALSKQEIMPDKLELGYLKLSLIHDNMIDIKAFKTSLIFSLISELFICALSFISVKVIRKIVSPMKEGKPFEKDISKNIRKYGVLVIIAGCLKAFINLIGIILMNRAIIYENIFNMENISNIDFQYDINLNFVIIGFVIFLISIIFEYGEELQIESDETL